MNETFSSNADFSERGGFAMPLTIDTVVESIQKDIIQHDDYLNYRALIKGDKKNDLRVLLLHILNMDEIRKGISISLHHNNTLRKKWITITRNSETIKLQTLDADRDLTISRNVLAGMQLLLASPEQRGEFMGSVGYLLLSEEPIQLQPWVVNKSKDPHLFDTYSLHRRFTPPKLLKAASYIDRALFLHERLTKIEEMWSKTGNLPVFSDSLIRFRMLCYSFNNQPSTIWTDGFQGQIANMTALYTSLVAALAKQWPDHPIFSRDNEIVKQANIDLFTHPIYKQTLHRFTKTKNSLLTHNIRYLGDDAYKDDWIIKDGNISFSERRTKNFNIALRDRNQQVRASLKDLHNETITHSIDSFDMGTSIGCPLGVHAPNAHILSENPWDVKYVPSDWLEQYSQGNVRLYDPITVIHRSVLEAAKLLE